MLQKPVAAHLHFQLHVRKAGEIHLRDAQRKTVAHSRSGLSACRQREKRDEEHTGDGAHDRAYREMINRLVETAYPSLSVQR